MRIFARTTGVAAAAALVLLVSPASALAAEPGDVTYSFTAVGSSIENTITNDSGNVITCTTSLAPAPDGVLPPVGEVIGNGQSLYESGEVPAGVTSTQVVTDVPAGTYVVLASCGLTEGDTTTVWISDYEGLEGFLAQTPWTSHTVQQASTIVTVR
ncbi:hypothetical protein [Rhodococcus sp. 077-4]|uniref:hypothetical protein n=1 Tax=Rhodococcus sp. 077-4 TaxID=2789271 RepID=UPI0039F56C46